jgi:hypothetical protein
MKNLLILFLFISSFCQAQNTIGFTKKELISWTKKHSLPSQEIDSLKVVKYQIKESIYEANLVKDTVQFINIIDDRKRLNKVKQEYDQWLYMVDKFKWMEYFEDKEYEYRIYFPKNNKEIIVTQIKQL